MFYFGDYRDQSARSPWVLQVMPQFTFACFCGLHGFCKMKRKKEEHSAEQETAVKVRTAAKEREPRS